MQTGVGRVVGMRPEDRQPAKRVFPLLQNLDLDSVTFSQLQSVGNPISVEDMNEQEMLDLIIVNLARLCCAGEWTGLLEAGGGGVNQLGVLTADGYDTYDVSVAAPFGLVHRDTAGSDDEPRFAPFYSPASGTVAAITIGVTSAASSASVFKVGLYNVDADTGLPSTSIASCEIDLESTGDIRQTSFTGTPTLTKNTLYMISWCRSNTVASTHRTARNVYSVGAGPTNSTEAQKSHLVLTSSDNTLPATVTAGNLETINSETPALLLEW